MTHITIPYPHPKPTRQSDVGSWRVTVRRGDFVETLTFATEKEARAYHIAEREKVSR